MNELLPLVLGGFGPHPRAGRFAVQVHICPGELPEFVRTQTRPRCCEINDAARPTTRNQTPQFVIGEGSPPPPHVESLVNLVNMPQRIEFDPTGALHPVEQANRAFEVVVQRARPEEFRLLRAPPDETVRRHRRGEIPRTSIQEPANPATQQPTITATPPGLASALHVGEEVFQVLPQRRARCFANRPGVENIVVLTL
ncbi:MAG: hypothetical protein WCS99_21220 [Limisphaerales bacterium]